MDDQDPKVWISREEYDKLKKLENNNNGTFFGGEDNSGPSLLAGPVLAQPAGHTALPPTLSSSPFSVFQVVAGVIIALLAFVYPPAIFLFVIFGALSIYDYMKAQRGQRREHKKVYLALVLLPLVVIAAPTVFIIGMIAVYIVACSINPCGHS